MESDTECRLRGAPDKKESSRKHQESWDAVKPEKTVRPGVLHHPCFCKCELAIAN